MTDKQFYALLYILVLVATGIGEYFKLVPMGTFAVIIGGVFGHGIANGNNGKGTTP